MSFTPDEAKSLSHSILSSASSLPGVQDAEVKISADRQSHLRFAAGSCTTSGSSQNRQVSLTLWVDEKKVATHSSNDLSSLSTPAGLKAFLDQTLNSAKRSAKDQQYVPSLKQQTYRETAAFSPATAKWTAKDRADQVATVLDGCDQAKMIGAGFYQTQVWEEADATLNGNFVFDRNSQAVLSLTARTPDGQGSGYYCQTSHDVRQINPTRIVQEATQKALHSQGARALEPGVYPVILEAQAAGDVLQPLFLSLDARRADEGRSALSAGAGKSKIGERIFDEKFQLVSDPWSPVAPGPIHANGLPATKVAFIQDGILKNLITSRFWAQKQGTLPTPGPVNMIFEASKKPQSLAEMIASSDRTILVTRFWYIRLTDPRTASWTGLTRDGLFWIEKGKIAYPIKNFRFNQSLTQLLAPGNLEKVGESIPIQSTNHLPLPLAAPAMKFNQFRFSSVSDAI